MLLWMKLILRLSRRLKSEILLPSTKLHLHQKEDYYERLTRFHYYAQDFNPYILKLITRSLYYISDAELIGRIR